MLLDAMRQFPAEIIVFGGDLVSEAFQIPASFRLLKRLPEAELKLAVPGNWDMHRRKWIREKYWQRGFQTAGFTLLRNDSVTYSGINVYGMDDFKLGEPVPPVQKPDLLITHNPDAFLAMPDLKFRLALCGHTHGGQWRIPGYGAISTSSRFGRIFERGIYQGGDERRIVVSAGIGMTWMNTRWFCPPEVLLMEFTK